MNKPLIAITCGDFNGIGPEIALKAVLTPAVMKICTPVLIGTKKIFDYYKTKLNWDCTLLPFDTHSNKISGKEVLFIEAGANFPYKIQPGKISIEAGKISIECTKIAVALCLSKVTTAMVTAPVSKEAMVLAGFKHFGQTEFLAELTNTKNFGMMLLTPEMKVSLATIHIPLKDVPANITKESLHNSLNILCHSLSKNFGIAKPRIAVLGLNPHAGENGLLGKEEQKIIIPTIRSMNKNTCIIEGPFPADGFFGAHQYKHYNAILAMYHDQGLTPLKMSGMNVGVNYTMGLPITRTSPDHGTAFAIAGKGIADCGSIVEALKVGSKLLSHQ